MKYFVIGFHGSGKQEVLDNLSQLGVKCGKLFSNVKTPSEDIYNSFNYELYSNQDIHSIFENNAYVFIQELNDLSNIASYKCFEGLSTHTLDNNDVFALSPDQVLSIAPNNLKEEVCFVWLDNTTSNRKSRYHFEKRGYNFSRREDIEKDGIQSFVKFIYGFHNSHLLYFTNEEPSRISTIIYSLIQHPDLFKLYEKTFI